MSTRRPMRRYLSSIGILAASGVVGLACLLSVPANAQTIVTDYTSLGNTTRSGPFSLSGVTATSSRTFNLDASLGLGVVGGSSN
jgi:hypothetical protein